MLLPILLVVPFTGGESGGHCINSTAYCPFGCCGSLDNQYCCFPVGVLIGCGFGILGAICLLITLFRCRLGGHERAGPIAQPGPHRGHVDSSLGPEYGQSNPAFSVEIRSMPSDHERRDGSLKCPSYTSIPPPSYEDCMRNLHQRPLAGELSPRTEDCARSVGVHQRHLAGELSSSIEVEPIDVENQSTESDSGDIGGSDHLTSGEIVNSNDTAPIIHEIENDGPNSPEAETGVNEHVNSS